MFDIVWGTADTLKSKSGSVTINEDSIRYFDSQHDFVEALKETKDTGKKKSGGITVGPLIVMVYRFNISGKVSFDNYRMSQGGAVNLTKAMNDKDCIKSLSIFFERSNVENVVGFQIADRFGANILYDGYEYKGKTDEYLNILRNGDNPYTSDALRTYAGVYAAVIKGNDINGSGDSTQLFIDGKLVGSLERADALMGLSEGTTIFIRGVAGGTFIILGFEISGDTIKFTKFADLSTGAHPVAYTTALEVSKIPDAYIDVIKPMCVALYDIRGEYKLDRELEFRLDIGDDRFNVKSGGGWLSWLD